MSLIPDFELGLWNAWIFILLGPSLEAFLGFMISGEAMKKAHITTAHSKIEKILGRIAVLLMFVFWIYSIFLPLKLGTAWFYVSLPICFSSLVIGYTSIVSFTTTPLDELVTKGAYRISRNPAGLSGFLLEIGVGIACASWVFLLYATIDMILGNISVRSEERYLLEKYGDAYQEYTRRTPRWIGIPNRRKSD